MSSNTLTLMAPKLWQPKIDIFNQCSVNPDCQIEANNDVAAVGVWLGGNENKTTFNTYKKEAERFLLWCVYERGLYLHQLKMQDFEAYFRFAQNPPLSWISGKRAGKKGRVEGEWRPFLGPLNKTSLMATIRIINSMMNYLVRAEYLSRNPIKLIKKAKHFSQEIQVRHLKMKERKLERDEWNAVQEAIFNLPEDSEEAIDYKLRIQFLFFLLYSLGLRIHEVATHTWGDFRQDEGMWCLKVLGKGNKLAEIQVNDQLLSMVKIYRLHLSKNPLPSRNETEHLIVSKRTKKPLGIRQLFGCVKEIGRIAAQKFKDQPEKAEKLKSISPHWIRHTLGTHMDQAGFSPSMIQAILRHESLVTSQIYIHTEEKQRHEAMQKIKMDFEPQLINHKEENLMTELRISLKGGPLNQVSGLERFIEILENQILQGLGWNRKEELKDLVNRYQQIKVFKGPLDITYIVDGKVDKDLLACIRKSITREGEIRMFESGVEIRCQ